MSQDNLDDDLLALLEDENNGSDQDAHTSSGRARSKSGGGPTVGGNAQGSAANGANGSSAGGIFGATGSGNNGAERSGSRAMMEVDEEDEEDGDDEAPQRRSSASKKRSSSSMGKRSSNSSNKKKRRLQAVVDDDEDEEEDEEDENPYPLEGMFRDEDDRERLMQMNELQREAELEGRREEIKRRTDRLALRKMLEKQQGGISGGASSSRRSAATNKSSSRSQRRRREVDSEDEDAEGSDEDLAEEQDEDDEDEDERPRSSRSGLGSSSIASTAKSRKRSAVGASATKSGALNELKQKREARRKGVRDDLDDDDVQASTKLVGSSDEETEASSYEDSDEERSRSRHLRRGASEHGRGDKGKKDKKRKDKTPWHGSTEPPSLRDLSLCQLTREAIEKMMYKPEWLEHLSGNYVRFQWKEHIDERGIKVTPIRIHEVLDARTESSTYYEIAPKKPCNLQLKVDWGNATKWVQASAVSNRPFRTDEYDRWILRLRGNKFKFPSRQELDGQQVKMDQFNSRTLIDEEIRAIVNAKQEAKANFRLMQESGHGAEAEELTDGNAPRSAKSSGGSGGGSGPPPGPPPPRPPGMEASGITQPSTQIASVLAPGARHDQATMAAMNERNRRADRERIKEAERRQAAAKRAAMGLAPKTAAPTAGAGGGLGRPPGSNGMTSLGGSQLGTPAPGASSQSRSSTPAPAQGPAASTGATQGVTTGNKASSNVVLTLDIDLGDF
ncbi:RNA polymerase-associated protein rtf1 [Tilletia horrida]|uniref:RNA polymerase-associated protein rtf1 n=1 Tax=Tilletia horrida TaxID=155126 RepID=A0AAN6G6Y1_9BASI|nr:RNA polymerase-associated protein rtf1 [Tilletia horrida]KAK0527955.1 RNA polymerase-associated protein rtf1 [Tilletia horrida]KAK0529430.1 RNA polymerase-associated protein rtf1 [Tilletia horrida]KAK0549573.1 RNA polymerase-associated protein rtf1 [Tilletia horrida]